MHVSIVTEIARAASRERERERKKETEGQRERDREREVDGGGWEWSVWPQSMCAAGELKQSGGERGRISAWHVERQYFTQRERLHLIEGGRSPESLEFEECMGCAGE